MTALALPALFAACTADEFVNEGGFDKVAERAKVSKNFSLITSEEANTRYSVDGETKLSFNFEEGDEIGAAIIDKMVPGAKPEEWTIIPSLAGNYPFKYDGSKWNSATELGIGHWLLVYPYTKEDNNRGAVSYSLPTVQKLYGEDGKLNLNAAIETGDKAVFASVLHEGETTLAAKLEGLYTYPKFVINFDNGLPITSVSQVVLEYDKGFEVKGGFHHGRVAEMFAAAEKATDAEAYWDEKQTADFLIQAGDDNIDGQNPNEYTTKATSKYLIAQLPENTPVKVNSITNNKYVEVRFMMPSVADAMKTYKKEDGKEEGPLKMHIYTNDGVYTISDVWGSIEWKSTTTDSQKEKALMREKTNTMNLSKNAPKKGKALMIVTNVKDWNALVDAYGATASQNIAIVGDEFSFNSNVKMPSKAIFNVKTAVSVTGDVTMENVNIENTVIVEKGAKLTTGEGFTADAVEVKKEAEMVIAEVLDEDGDVVSFGKVGKSMTIITNEGKLTVEEGAEAIFKLDNEEGAEVENNGEMNVQGENKGKITNNAVMNTVGDFENATRVYKNGNVIEPTIINAKTGKILAQEGTLTNYAKIENNNVLTCKNSSGKIVNSEDEGYNKTVDGVEVTVKVPAVLDSKSGAITYITENAKGKVIVYSAETDNLTIAATNKGIVEYTTKNGKENFKNSLVNTVIASGSLEITEGEITSLTFNGDATLKVTKDKAEVSYLTVNSGKTTLGTDLSLTSVNVAKGAMIVVPAAITMVVTGDEMNNLGTILVGGAFKAEKILAADGGKVEDNGGTSQITWRKTSEEEKLNAAKEAYEAALETAIGKWIMTPNGMTTVNKLGYDIINGKNGKKTAAEQFEYYVGAMGTVNEVVALNKKLAEYKALNDKATLTESYATVAAAVVAEIEASAAFKNIVGTLEWTAADATEGAARIYKDDKNAEGTVTKTAATKAIEAFKSAVSDGIVNITDAKAKVAICSSSKNYAPAGSQVFVTDLIYTIFGEEGIRFTDDWTNAGFDEAYNSTTTWTLDEVKGWINEAARSTDTDNLFVAAAKKYVKDNDLINKMRGWKYDENIVAAIAEDQFQ